MGTEIEMKESIAGYVAVAIAIIGFVGFFAAYLMGWEMALFLFLMPVASLIGIILGAAGAVASSIRKRTRKRMAVWGIALNAGFILTVIAMFSYSMGGP